MKFQSDIIEFNERRLKRHLEDVELTKQRLRMNDKAFEGVIREIQQLQVAVPSWALGTGGTRFGRFPLGGEPRTLEEKIEDVGLIHLLSRATDSVSLHIPWDVPSDVQEITALLDQHSLRIDAVNSNTFQDQRDQDLSYKFGSLSDSDPAVRRLAIDHNLEVIEHGVSLGSTCLSVWLADGTNFPGQADFRRAYRHTVESLKEIYAAMPANWTMLVEYKPYEPNFYSMVLPDWGAALKMCESCGERAHVLVDLGHHLPNTNVEQIVARLLHFGRLGGFHFNGSQYGDDDLTTGAIKPYQLFLIFLELVAGATDKTLHNPAVAYMIDASHNTKDPIEDLLMSLENIRIAYTKARLVDLALLGVTQEGKDVAGAEQLLQNAFQSDVRPLVAEARRRAGGALFPIEYFREHRVRERLIDCRGRRTIATGL